MAAQTACLDSSSDMEYAFSMPLRLQTPLEQWQQSDDYVAFQVYRHHCVSALSAKHQRWRDCALYIVKNINAVKWALDFCGFRDVAIPVHSMQVNSTTDGAQSAVLVNIRFSVQLAL